MRAPLLLCADGGSTRLVVAVVAGEHIVAEAESVATAAHGVSILSLVEDVTTRAGLTSDAFDGLVMAIGPGSFTGLRTALSTFKGLALGWGKPIVGVSTLHALARSVDAGEGTLTASVLDARKSEVYGAVFRRGKTPADDVEVIHPLAVSAKSFGEMLTALNETMRWAGEMAKFPNELPSSSIAPWQSAVPSMAALAACALHRLPAGDVLDTLEPLYVRRSYADLSLGQKKGGAA